MLDFRQLLYTLKQFYGFPIALYERAGEVLDLQTGQQSVTEVKHPVRRALVLPVSAFQKYFRHAGQVAFEYAGDLRLAKRVFIIDRRDISGLTVTNDWAIIYDHKRYTIDILEGFEDNQSYYIAGKEVSGAPVTEQIDVCLHDWVYVSDSGGQPFDASLSDGLTLTDSCTGVT